MFRLQEFNLEDTIEEWNRLREVLQTERDNQLAILRRLDDVWEGEAHQAYKDVHRALLMIGLYQQAEEIVERIYRILSDIHLQINMAMQRCDKMPDQLDYDEYIPPYLNGCGYFNNGLLMLDDTLVAGCNGAIEDVLEEAWENRTLLYNAMNACAGVIDFTYEQEELNASYRKLKRLEHFRTEFNKYVQEVNEIQDELRIRLRAVMNEYGEATDHYWAQIAEEQCNGTKYIYTREQICGLNLPPEIEECVEQNYLKMALENRGLTVEQYRASVLDVFMYLDFFNSDIRNGYDYLDTAEKIYDGMTVNDILTLLGEYNIYTNGSKVNDSNRHIYYAILKDAVAIDPALGELQVSSMSRMLSAKDVGMELNEGTNGMVFSDTKTDTVYVAYRGTSTGEWGDDGERLNCKTMDDLTPQMEQTLAYFDYVARDMGWTEDMNIYVTGHSQGGNDAQISILLSPYGKYVDACYSFDGEGHSPELLEDIKQTYGAEEFEKRVGRMYSICGEYDFVNRLGEKVISEENTIYIKCHFEEGDFARAHDIVSMFCDGEMNYNGMINTGIGTEASWVTEYTAKVWEEMYEMPDDMRESCQAALMNILEIGLSKLECTEGLNGEKAGWKDYLRLIYGLDVMGESGAKVGLDTLKKKLLEDYVSEELDKAVKEGMIPDAMADSMQKEIEEIVERYLEGFDLYTDLKQIREYDEFTLWNIPETIQGKEGILWEDTYRYKIAEKCMEYLMEMSAERREKLWPDGFMTGPIM